MFVTINFINPNYFFLLQLKDAVNQNMKEGHGLYGNVMYVKCILI